MHWVYRSPQKGRGVCVSERITFEHALILLPLLSSECQEVAAGRLAVAAPPRPLDNPVTSRMSL